MSGRHAFSAASNTLGDSKIRTAAVALAAGAMFGAAFPTAATLDDASGSRALAELKTSGKVESNAITADSAVISADVDNLEVGQLVVEDSVTADNVDLSLEVQLPAASAATARAQANTAAGQPAAAAAGQPAAAAAAAPASGPLLSTAEAGSIVSYARQFAGTPYVYGGTTPAGFDCSGFTQYVFAQFGYSLPRTAGAQGAAGYRVSAAEAQPGDLVVWGARHVGIYTGNGNHIAAHKPGTPLSEGPLYGSYYFVRVG